MNKRKDGRWRESVKLPGMTAPRYFYGKAGDSDTKQQRDIKRQIAEWTKAQAAPKTFDKAATAWEEEHREQVTHNAAQFYAAPLARAREQFGKRELSSISSAEIDALLRKVAAAGYARRTVQAYRDMLSMIFDYAAVQGWVSANPCAAVRMPRNLPSGTREIPTDEQIEKVKAALHLEFGLFAAFLLYTGMRRGELLALRWEDIDRKAGVIHVTKSVYFEGNNPKIKTPKTEAGKRSIILLDALAELLPEWGAGYIFGGDKPLTKTQERKMWLKWCRAAGLATAEEQTHHSDSNNRDYTATKWNADITPHQLRHYYATMLFDAGVEPKDAQDLLGHSSIKVTQDIYTHIRQQRRENTAAKLNSFVNSAGSNAGQKAENP